jgi:hypothetical protein
MLTVMRMCAIPTVSATLRMWKKWRLDASSISRLRQRAMGSKTSKRWMGFIMAELKMGMRFYVL